MTTKRTGVEPELDHTKDMNANTSPTPLRNQTMIPVDINDKNYNHSPLALLSRAAAAEAACDALGDSINNGDSSAQLRKRKSHSLSNHSTTMSSFIPPLNNNDDKNKMMNKSHGAVVGVMKSSSSLVHTIPPAAVAVSSDDYDGGSASRFSSRPSSSQPPWFLIPPPPSSMVNSNSNSNNAVSSSPWPSKSLEPSTVLGVFPQFSYPSSSLSSLPQQDHLSISPEMEITLTHPQPITTTATQATSKTQQQGERAAINNNNSRRDGKYRMKYTYYSMSRIDAHRYIQELTDTSNMQEQKRRMLRLREISNSNSINNNLSNSHAPVVDTTTPSYYPLVDKNPPPPPIPFHSSPHQITPAINKATSYLISTTNGGGASGLLW